MHSGFHGLRNIDVIAHILKGNYEHKDAFSHVLSALICFLE